MSATTSNHLQISDTTTIDWRCRLPNLTVATCATSNFTANSACQHWIYDKSIFVTTIVSDVSSKFTIQLGHLLLSNI